MQMTETHRAALHDLLRWRRDVRHFRPDPLPEAMVETLQAAMEMAPSVGNARPWRVIRVTDDTLRAGVRASFAACNAQAAEGYEGEARQAYLALKLAGLDAAPLQLAVFTETAPEQGRGLGRRTMPETLEQSTAMAIHALWLTARAHDVGLGMVSILDPAEISRLFDAPETWRFSAYLCLGRAEFDDDTPLLHRSGWQENRETDWQTR
ncbi:5,6-dimethylbenzimidazole synthase [Thetidibacter halocola]|uniref:5,6-dimethylbenzimidazole synthase n=1 Tax=Thetidibacter halocola TaxID=2827239 RepID=A0A8J7WE20_9RHOB|nr:5,6-dimethylbenzimidazole synthase [Thetidibacter halocola]MBS0123996.1 5,6-dimethylbenzimidazole synthase [Thetidibacter halocola]